MATAPFLFVDKPAGVTTHSSLNENEKTRPLADRNDGWVEHLSSRFAQDLFVVHRLDKGTTGSLCLARDKDSAAWMQEAFASRSVRKTYLFLTDREIDANEFRVESFIERRGSRYVSVPASDALDANAITDFRKIESDHGLSLWEAKPSSGKPHQIRLHAESKGLSILGDVEHGGSSFVTLCLHSSELSFIDSSGREWHHSTPAPRWFSQRELALDPLLCRWLAAIDRRERLLRSWAASGEDLLSNELTLRWIHTDGGPLRVEQLGAVHWFSWYGEHEPGESEWRSIRRLTEIMGWNRWYLQVRGNRGRSPNEESMSFGPEEFPPRWSGSENSLRFEFRTESGLSPGLFLDQRRNRRWVKENARGLTVLNLFCYTGGFSVCAAHGGALKTVSVDVSKTFLDWAKTNFALNELSIDGHEFRAMDSREYLAWAQKKNLRFDLVICDPPSFGRSKAGVFSMEKDFSSLMESLLNVTNPQGRILFSSNFEKWSVEDFAERALKIARERKIRIHLEPTPSPDWDFEISREERNMKSFFVVRSR